MRNKKLIKILWSFGLAGIIILNVFAGVMVGGVNGTACAKADASFSPPHYDFGVDTNSNNLYEYLVIGVNVSIPTLHSGDYYIYGALYDITNSTYIWTTYNFTYLSTGTRTVYLYFDGGIIRNSGINGPYVAYLVLMEMTGESYDNDTYITNSYLTTDFEKPVVEFAGNYSDYGVDIDADGLYDFLTIDVNVNVSEAGYYRMEGSLYNSSQSIIDHVVNFTYLNEGTNISVKLSFDGRTIYTNGTSGVYHLQDLYVVYENSTLVGYRQKAYTTSSYNPTMFQNFTGFGVNSILKSLWNYHMGKICYRMTFSSSPAIANLGIEQNMALQIVTGSDEYYPYGYYDVNGLWRAFNSNGTVLWSLDTKNDESRSSPAVADVDGDGDFEIAGGTTSGWQIQLINHSGNYVWIYDTTTFVHSSPAIAEVDPSSAGLEIIGASFDSNIYVLSATGDFLWNYSTSSAIVSSPAVADIDDDGYQEIVIGSTDGKIYCFNGFTGALEWSYTTGDAVYSSAALANLSGDEKLEVVIGSNDGKLYCFDSTGSMIWNYTTNGSVYSSPSMGDIDNDGSLEIVVGSVDGKVYALNALGVLEWTCETGGAVYSSPAIAYRGSNSLGIYIGTEDGYLYIIDGGTGSVIDKFLAFGRIRTSPSVADINGDGKLEIVFMDWNGVDASYNLTDYFWCLQDTTSTCNAHALEWPMFRHDSYHSGLYAGISNQPPVASFTYSPASPTVNDVIQFNDTSTDPDGYITSWFWDFGDGNTSMEQNPTHQYADAGNYSVSLTVTDDDGASDTKIVWVNVAWSYQGTLAGYVLDNATGLGLNGAFVNVSYHEGYQNTYTDETGYYYIDNIPICYCAKNVTVSKEGYVTKTELVGIAEDTWLNFTLDPIPIENQPPVVNITYPEDGQSVNGTITITGTASDPDETKASPPPDGTTVQQVEIKIDDGEWQLASGTTAWSFEWDTTTVANGWHTIYARAFDGIDYSEIKSVSVYVDNPAVNQPPVANFTYSPLIPSTLTFIQFNDTSTDTDGEIVSWLWNFGDGNTSTLQNLTHQYGEPGNYIVALTVWDDKGANDTITKVVTVEELKGTLSGYVMENITFNPIQNALVNVSYHETYQNTYTDENGYYYIDNIPICYCVKNVTVSKEEYITETEWIGIAEGTWLNFTLEAISVNQPPVVNITYPEDGQTVNGTVTISGSAYDPDSAGLVHNLDKDTWYNKIQDAVDDSDVGNTIFVYSGVYYENVVINKALTLIGENRETTIIDGGGGAAVWIEADWVNVSRFGVGNSFWAISGIEIFSSYNTITNCSVYNNDGGIGLYSSNNNIINCSVYNSYYGIYIEYTLDNYNNITNCAIYDNTYGIYLYFSPNNEIHHNNIYNNYYGVYNFKAGCQVNATYNWWGSADGPSGAGDGSGDAVSDNVLYDPWLTEPAKSAKVNYRANINCKDVASNGTTVQFVEIKIDDSDWQLASGTTSWSFGWDTTTVSNGWHTIYARAFDGINYSGVVSVDVYVDNPILKAVISSPKEGDVFSTADIIYFDGANSTSIINPPPTYNWTSNISGFIGNTSQFYASLPAGNHLITLWVSVGDCTDYATVNITVIAPNQPPTAFIDSITPNPAIQGETVSFAGHGDDSDGSVVDYYWYSNLDGFLSSQSSFSSSTLSVGTHTISFKVMDDDGVWSDWDTKTLVINLNVPPTVNITYPVDNQTVNGVITITGTASDSDGTVQKVEIKIDDSNWQLVTGTTSWSFDWDTTLLLDGLHTIHTKSYDGFDYSETKSVQINVLNVVNQPPVAEFVFYQGVDVADGEEINVTLRVSGEKYRFVNLSVYEDDVEVGFISLERKPGAPETNYTLITINSSKIYNIIINYTADKKGGNPVWLDISYRGVVYDEHMVFHETSTEEFNLSMILDGMIRSAKMVRFDGSGSYDPDGWVVNYTWDFGDGCLGYGEVVVHIYDDYGTYTVVLSVMDDSGDVGEVSEDVDILDAAGDYAACMGMLGVELDCPADLLITDRYLAAVDPDNSTIGWLDGRWVNYIPNASMILFDDVEIYFIPRDGDYAYRVSGNGDGSYVFSVFDPGEYDPGEYSPGEYGPGEYTGKVYRIDSAVTNGSMDELVVGNGVVSVSSSEDKYYSLYIKYENELFSLDDVHIAEGVVHNYTVTDWSVLSSTEASSVRLEVFNGSVLEAVQELCSGLFGFDLLKPDLVIVNVAVLDPLKEGEIVSFSVEIWNKAVVTPASLAVARNVYVELWVDGEYIGSSSQISSIYSNRTASTVVQWRVKSGSHTLRFVVCADDDINQGNNEYVMNVDVEGKKPLIVISPETAAIAAGTGIGAGLVLFALIGTEIGKYKMFTFLAPLYMKMRKDELLSQYTRGRIHGFIEANPGAHYSLIKRTLDIRNGTLAYHLDILEKSGLIMRKKDGFRERFFPANKKLGEINYLSKSEEAAIDEIRAKPGISQKMLASRLRISQPLTSYYTTKMVDMGIINAVKEGKEIKYYLKKESDET